ncbi:hypothetical protein ACFQ46_09465 [Kineococcus sp. GCM10028916]|uniref:hypothetical protein n=1 Tax=Kineococcus sp. GCM10028916 TaxID=3273394 RepID=UPI00363501B6
MNRPRPATPREVHASRWVAVTGVVAAVLHVPLAIAHAGASLPLAGVLLVMSLVCLPCAGHLWRSPSPRTWTLVAAAGTVMLVTHAALLVTPAGGSASVLPPSGHAGHTTTLADPWHSPVLLALVSVLTLAQVATCLHLLAGRPHLLRGRGTMPG